MGQVSEATGVRGWDPQRRTVPRRIRDPLRSTSFDPTQEKLPRDGHWFTHDWGCPVSGSVRGVGVPEMGTGLHTTGGVRYQAPSRVWGYTVPTTPLFPSLQSRPRTAPSCVIHAPRPAPPHVRVSSCLSLCLGVVSWLRAASGLAVFLALTPVGEPWGAKPVSPPWLCPHPGPGTHCSLSAPVGGRL